MAAASKCEFKAGIELYNKFNVSRGLKCINCGDVPIDQLFDKSCFGHKGDCARFSERNLSRSIYVSKRCRGRA